MIKTILLVISFIYILTGCSNKNEVLTHKLKKEEMIYSIKQAKKIDINKLAKELEHYPVIFVGDHHNTEKTHKFFKELLEEVAKQNYNIYLINEWFTPDHNTLLKEFTDNKIDATKLKEKREWDKFTKYKWEYVEPLYQTVKNSKGKLYGMNLSKKEREKISLKKFEEMSKKEKNFYDSLDLNISAHSQLVMPYLKHCNKMPQKSSEPCEQRMYRVQVAWDTYMASNVNKIANKVLKTSKDKLFVFVGAMHVEQNLGIPLRFSRLNNLPFITISNEKINKEENLELDTNKADFIYIYE